jgi:hypothetical protein
MTAVHADTASPIVNAGPTRRLTRTICRKIHSYKGCDALLALLFWGGQRVGGVLAAGPVPPLPNAISTEWDRISRWSQRWCPRDSSWKERGDGQRSVCSDDGGADSRPVRLPGAREVLARSKGETSRSKDPIVTPTGRNAISNALSTSRNTALIGNRRRRTKVTLHLLLHDPLQRVGERLGAIGGVFQ